MSDPQQPGAAPLTTQTSQEVQGDAPTYIPSLDGVRAIAVGLVIAFHLGLSWAPGGFIGVDVFFVLSGYLITTLLLRDLDRDGRVRFGRFYARRARRLLPAAAFTLTVVMAVGRYLLPLGDRWSLWHDAKAAALYLANWHLIWSEREYFTDDSIPGALDHWWSLAVEEQFYIVWPLLLLGLWLLGRASGDGRRLGVAIGALFAASAALSLVLTPAAGYYRYYSTFTRAYHLLAGALVATLLARSGAARIRSLGPGVGTALSAASLGVLVFLAVTVEGADGYPGLAGLAVTAAAVVLIVSVVAIPAGPIHRALGSRPMAAAGRLSYSLYLWHWPVIVFTPVVAGRAGFGRGDDPMLLVALTFAAAGLSYLGVERPIRFKVWTTARPQRVILAGLTLSLLVAGVARPAVLPGALAGERIERSAGPPGASDVISVPTDLVVAASRDIASSRPCPYANIDWDARPEDAPVCVLRRGKGPTIALAGDSHAQMWLPAIIEIADRVDATLVPATRGGCGWTSVSPAIRDERGRLVMRRSCSDWRDPYYDKVIRELRPDVVFLGTRSHVATLFDGPRLIDPAADPVKHRELWRRGAQRNLQRFAAGGAHVIAFESLPEQAGKIPDCIYRNPRDAAACDYPVEADDRVGGYNAILRAVAEGLEQVHVLSMVDVVCPEQICPAVLGYEITHRDDDHLAASFVRELTNEISARARAMGAQV